MAERDKWLNEVAWNMFALGRAPDELRSDREVVKAACMNSGVAFRYASQELRSDPDFARDVVQASAVALEYVSDSLRYDRGFVLAVVAAKGEALAYCEDDFRSDRQVVVAAAAQDPGAQKHALPPLDTDPTVASEAAGGAPPPVYAAPPPQVYDSPPPVYASAGEDVKDFGGARQDNNGDAPDESQSRSLPKPDPEALEQEPQLEFALNENVAILSDDWYTDGLVVEIAQEGYVVHFCQGTQEVLVPFDLAPQHMQKVATIEAQPVACDMGPGDAVLSAAYRKGDPVQVYSSSKQAWLDGEIVETCDTDSEFNGEFIPAGSCFVQYGGVDVGGQNLGKWVMPDQVEAMLRPTPQLTPEEADRREAERLEADRLEAKAQRMEQEAAERRAAEQAAVDQAAADQVGAQRAAEERAQQAAADQAAADQAAADQAAADQAAADRAAAQQAAAQQAAAQQAAAEQAAAEQAAQRAREDAAAQAKAERQRQAAAEEQRRTAQEEANARAKQEAEAKQAADAAAAAAAASSAGDGFVNDPSLSEEQCTQVQNLMKRSGANQDAVVKALKASGWHAGKAFRDLSAPAKGPGRR